jgi:dTDP-4-dehydrorhamnose 3,5-epimerase
MKIFNTRIKDLKIIQHNKFLDKRGFLKITFHNKIINFNKFVFEYSVTSKKNVIRGLHFQSKFQQAKLIYVLKGKILDVVVDLRKSSPTFGKYYSIILSDKNCKALYVPEGFAHGYFCYEKLNIIYYKLSNYYKPEYESGIKWDDKKLKISWPSGKKIISNKDKNLQDLDFFKKRFKAL